VWEFTGTVNWLPRLLRRHVGGLFDRRGLPGGCALGRRAPAAVPPPRVHSAGPAVARLPSVPVRRVGDRDDRRLFAMVWTSCADMQTLIWACRRDDLTRHLRPSVSRARS